MQVETPPPPRPTRSSGLADAIETFRLPLYGRLWTSNLIQFVCFQVLGLAMLWLVTSLTASRSALGFVGFVQGGTIALASPVAGVIVDRYAKRSLIALGRVGLAGVGLCIAWLIWNESVAYWHLLVAALVGGVLAALLQPATQTFVVDVVGRQRTEHAVSLNAMGSSFGSMSGGEKSKVAMARVSSGMGQYPGFKFTTTGKSNYVNAIFSV